MDNQLDSRVILHQQLTQQGYVYRACYREYKHKGTGAAIRVPMHDPDLDMLRRLDNQDQLTFDAVAQDANLTGDNNA